MEPTKEWLNENLVKASLDYLEDLKWALAQNNASETARHLFCLETSLNALDQQLKQNIEKPKQSVKQTYEEELAEFKKNLEKIMPNKKEREKFYEAVKEQTTPNKSKNHKR